MKKTILTLMLAAMSSGVWAEWVKISEFSIPFPNGNVLARSFVDPATVRSNGNLRRATFLGTGTLGGEGSNVVPGVPRV